MKKPPWAKPETAWPSEAFKKSRIEKRTIMLMDSYNRRLDYLRVSLTDRCNLRCVYCMPPEGIKLLPRTDILRLDEMERLIRIFVGLGIIKVRLTGGEPLLRRKLVSLVSALSALEGIKEIALTTNGVFLSDLADPFKEAGLSGVNISLDSLNKERFAQITRRDLFDQTLKGLKAALKVGLKTKINVVALEDLSLSEVFDFCDLAMWHDLEVRFLEFMPLCGSGWFASRGLDMSLLKSWIETRFELNPLDSNGEVATTFELKGGLGRVGFISSMTQPFCGSCRRLRLTSTGALRLCLFSPLEVDLRGPLRSGASDDFLARLIQEAVLLKPRGHEEPRSYLQETRLPLIRSIGG